MKQLYIYLVMAIVLLTSCDKDITIDYHKVKPLYVVEASITGDGAKATITRTINVQDTTWNENVENAIVTITSDNGEAFILNEIGKGNYESVSAKATEGHTYTIKVKIGDYETESQSVMQKQVVAGNDLFYKVGMMGSDVICYRVDVMDDGIGTNYYYAILSRNGKQYKWNINDNRGANGRVLLDVWCFLDSDQEKDKKDILNEGDIMEVEVRKIDQRTYDYLLSLLLTEEANSNPIKNFSNETLGYFSAFTSQKLPAKTFNKESLPYFEDRAKQN